MREAAAPSPAHLIEAVYNALPPELKESLSPADMQLALEDRGWINLNQGGDKELTPAQRKITIQTCRAYAQGDPLGKQAVRIWTNYCFGSGLSYKTKVSGVQTKLDKFFKLRKNRKLLSTRGQLRLSRKLLIDGDIFFALITNGDVPIIRTLDPVQISLISDPEDEENVLCYKREVADGQGTRTLYYKDWAADDDEISGLKDPENKKEITAEDNVVVYHLAFEEVGKRGSGLLTGCIDWTREHRRFMVARVALTQALAKLAWKFTVKGGQKAVDSAAAFFNSSMTSGGYNRAEKNPPTAPGGTFVQNQGADMTPMPRATGGGDAKSDGDQLIRQVCSGTGVFFHYLTGDPSTGNLATATAMELPMLKEFYGYQELWQEAFRDIFSIVLGEKPEDEQAEIDIELPPILDEDPFALGSFITQVTTAFPESKVPELLRRWLLSIDIENIDEIMDAIAELKVTLDADQKAKDALANPPQSTDATPPGSLPNKPPVKYVAGESDPATLAALDRLTLILAEGNRQQVLPPIMPEINVSPEITIGPRLKKKTGKAWREADGSMGFEVEETSVT